MSHGELLMEIAVLWFFFGVGLGVGIGLVWLLAVAWANWRFNRLHRKFMRDQPEAFKPIHDRAVLAPCTVPPPGWWCSRGQGHDGPCAARPTGDE